MPPITPNQIVAWNLTRARNLRGWTQDEAAGYLEPHLGERWSRTTVSMAERSANQDARIRRFDADDLLALSRTFDLPITFFLTPPSWAEAEGVSPAGSDETTAVADYLDRVFDVGSSAHEWLLRMAVPMTGATTRALRRWGSNFAAMVAHREAEVSALVAAANELETVDYKVPTPAGEVEDRRVKVRKAITPEQGSLRDALRKSHS